MNVVNYELSKQERMLGEFVIIPPIDGEKIKLRTISEI